MMCRPVFADPPRQHSRVAASPVHARGNVEYYRRRRPPWRVRYRRRRPESVPDLIGDPFEGGASEEPRVIQPRVHTCNLGLGSRRLEASALNRSLRYLNQAGQLGMMRVQAVCTVVPVECRRIVCGVGHYVIGWLHGSAVARRE